MRKTTIASMVAACVSFVLFAVSIVFIKWSRESDNPTSSILITSILLLTVVACATVVLLILFDKKHQMLFIAPIVALFAGSIMFTKGINEVTGGTAASIIDFISPSSNNPTVFALLLAIVFIVSVVLVLSKKYKFASIIAISYASILIVTNFSNLADVFFVEKNLLYVFSSLGLIAALISLIIFLASPFVENNEIVRKPKPEKVEAAEVENAEAPVEEEKKEKKSKKDKKAKEEKAEEAPVEAAENTEAPVEEKAEEEKVEENNDPFKNQYSSSSTVFDVQDDAEKNQE